MFAFNYPGTEQWRSHSQKQEMNECEMGPFQQEHRESFDEVAGMVERDLPSDVRRQRVSGLDRTIAVAEDEMVDNENLSPCSSTSEGSFRL